MSAPRRARGSVVADVLGRARVRAHRAAAVRAGWRGRGRHDRQKGLPRWRGPSPATWHAPRNGAPRPVDWVNPCPDVLGTPARPATFDLGCGWVLEVVQAGLRVRPEHLTDPADWAADCRWTSTAARSSSVPRTRRDPAAGHMIADILRSCRSTPGSGPTSPCRGGPRRTSSSSRPGCASRCPSRASRAAGLGDPDVDSGSFPAARLARARSPRWARRARFPSRRVDRPGAPPVDRVDGAVPGGARRAAQRSPRQRTVPWLNGRPANGHPSGAHPTVSRPAAHSSFDQDEPQDTSRNQSAARSTSSFEPPSTTERRNGSEHRQRRRAAHGWFLAGGAR